MRSVWEVTASMHLCAALVTLVGRSRILAGHGRERVLVRLVVVLRRESRVELAMGGEMGGEVEAGGEMGLRGVLGSEMEGEVVAGGEAVAQRYVVGRDPIPHVRVIGRHHGAELELFALV